MYDIFVGFHQSRMAPGAHFGCAFYSWHRELLFRWVSLRKSVMYQWWTMKNRQKMLIIFTCIQLRINNESQLAQLQKTILIPQELLCNHSLVLCKIYHSKQPNMFKSRHRTENMKNHSPCHRTTQPNIVPFPQYPYLILNKSSINSAKKKRI